MRLYQKLFILLYLWPVLLFSQDRPEVVDVREYFPPVISEDMYNRDDLYLSTVYYLKSALWNREFNRDPSLSENQFSPGYMLAMSADIRGMKPFTLNGFFTYLQEFGGVSMFDYSYSDYWQGEKINSSLQEKALKYLTKNCYYYGNLTSLLSSIKDSLAKELPLVISVFVPDNLNGIVNKRDNILEVSDYQLDNSWQPKYFAVTGYNDTISTESGQGALQLLNYNPVLPEFYISYDYLQNHILSCFFLQEDFIVENKVALHINLSQSIDVRTTRGYKYLFTDTLVIEEERSEFTSELVDYPLGSEDYFVYKGLAKVIEVNGQRLSLREKQIALNGYSANSYHQLISNISSLFSQSNFDSLKVLLYDPIAVSYLNEAGDTIYAYDKVNNFNVESSYLHFLGDDKKIAGRVEDLPDTSWIFADFYSEIVERAARVGELVVYVNKANFSTRRKIITFNKDDSYQNNPPVFTASAPRIKTVFIDSIYTYNFRVNDVDGDEVYLSCFPPHPDVEFGSSSGEFTFNPKNWGEYEFTIIASDGKSQSFANFLISVIDKVEEELEFDVLLADSNINILSGEIFNFSFLVYDYDLGLELLSFAVVETSAPEDSYYLGKHNGRFVFLGTDKGDYDFTIMASSQGDTIYQSFTVSVDYPVGVEEVKLAKDLSIYPNPAESFVTIEIKSPTKSSLYLKVIDISGQVKDEIVYNNLSTLTNLQYSTSSLESGIYIFYLRDDNNVVRVGKVIKK